MSRSGYSDDYCDDRWAMVRWRGAVASAIKGKRGQAFLREMLAALDAMPEKRLIANGVVCADGVCAMGAVAAARGIGAERFYDEENVPAEQVGTPIGNAIDINNRGAIANLLGIAEALAAEVAYENDKAHWGSPETPEHRWRRMRQWVVDNLRALNAGKRGEPNNG